MGEMADDYYMDMLINECMRGPITKDMTLNCSYCGELCVVSHTKKGKHLIEVDTGIRHTCNKYYESKFKEFVKK